MLLRLFVRGWRSSHIHSAAARSASIMAPMDATVAALLAQFALPHLEVRVLLAHVLERDRAWLAAHGEAEVDQRDAERFRDLCARRIEGEPIAYLVGEREFF